MYCILVSGIPASGKSTIARILSERLSLPVLSKDCIKEVLFDQIGFDSRSEKVALGVAAMEVMYYAAEQLMKTHLPFILENNFEHSSAEGILSRLAQFDCKALTVSLTGDYEIIYRRFLERNASPDRHRGHIVNDCYPEKTPRSTEELLAHTISCQEFIDGIHARGFDSFSAGEKRIIVDTTDFSSMDIDSLIGEIHQWISSLHS